LLSLPLASNGGPPFGAAGGGGGVVVRGVPLGAEEDCTCLEAEFMDGQSSDPRPPAGEAAPTR